MPVAAFHRKMHRPAAVAAFAAIVADLLGAGQAVQVPLENGVMVLDNSNFDDVVRNKPVVMVEFYAPGCGHCKEFQPSYDKAAKNLKKRDPPIRLAKVDGTASAELAKKYDVSSYPTIIAFKDGEWHSNFDWAPLREKQEIQQHMEAVVGNPLLFKPQIMYNTVRGFWKLMLRNTDLLSAGGRKFLYQAFPFFLSMPMWIPIIYMLCCRGSKSSSCKLTQYTATNLEAAADVADLYIEFDDYQCFVNEKLLANDMDSGAAFSSTNSVFRVQCRPVAVAPRV